MESVALGYHVATKYARDTIHRLPPVDPDQQPLPYKEYHSERAVELRGMMTDTGEPARPRAGHPLPLGVLARLLYFTNGVTGLFKHPGGVQLFRAAPSAGALYPTEIYAVTEGVPGLIDAVHNYSVPRHALVPVFDGGLLEDLRAAAGDDPALAGCSCVLVLTGIFQRSAFRYHDRAYRRILLDTGHVLGNLRTYSAAEGLRADPVFCFRDQALAQLLFLDTEVEGPLLLVGLHAADTPVIEPALHRPPVRASIVAPRPAPGAPDLPLGAGGPSSGGDRDPWWLACHRAGELEELDPVPASLRLQQGATAPGSHGLAASEGQIALRGARTRIAQPGLVIARRRSTRTFTAGPLPLARLGALLGRAYHPDLRAQLAVPGWIDTHLIVRAVPELEPGVYRYDPASHSVSAVRTGEFRATAEHFCLGQELGRDAAVLVVHSADLPRAVEGFGDRVYRLLHLDAGTIGQVLNLAAIELDFGVSGIGGFFDDEVNETIGIPPDHAILYLTTLGEAEPAT